MNLIEDVRFGLRSMAKNPGFTGVAIAALALGIGVNAVVFAIVDAVLLKGIPFVGDNVLYLSTRNAARPNANDNRVSFPDFRDWSAQAKSFEGMALYDANQMNVSDKSGVPTRFNVATITPNTFTLIGQRPVIGRDFTAADGKPGAPLVAILGDRIWTERYGRNPAVLGSIIRINSVPAMIIGVMRPEFRFPDDADLWLAYPPDSHTEMRDSRGFTVVGKLTPGATQISAQAEMDTIARNLEKAYPDTNKGIGVRVRTYLQEAIGSDLEAITFALMGSVLFVLMIACANVANMLLARAVDRSREISIRIALGAGRWRIIRQLLVESAMLSIAGGFLGWLISKWGLHLFEANTRDRIPAYMNFSMDYRGFAYLAAISIGTGILFGLAPALRLSRLDVNTSLKAGGRGSSAGGRGKLLSKVLVVSEMALAVVLLAGAGLMVRSFLNVYQTKAGVNEKNVLVMRLAINDKKFPRPEDMISFHDRLKARIEALPGVAVSCISITMPTGGSFDYPFEIEGRPPVDKQRETDAVMVISPDYFHAMDVRISRGRGFSETDGLTGPGVAIVNQKFADKEWPGEDAIGKRVRIYKDKKFTPWLSVVGVAPNILQNAVTAHEFDPLLYVPYRQMPSDDMSLMARTTVPPLTLASAIRREVQALDEDMPVYNLRTLEERLAVNYWDQKIFGTLFGTFAIIALLLASIGLYAVIAHSVSQRTQEIGVRMALGASAANVLGLVLRQGLVQLGIGLAIGLAGAFATTRLIASELQDVKATDPATFALISLVLSGAAILGCLIPARRAMAVDPVVALRNE
jgi:putative ABC transport system permease protein